MPPLRIAKHVHKYYYAKIAQLVERHLAKVEVAGSNPVFRSTENADRIRHFLLSPGCIRQPHYADVVESVDTPDLKSCAHLGRAGSSPAISTESPLLYALGIFYLWND